LTQDEGRRLLGKSLLGLPRSGAWRPRQFRRKSRGYLADRTGESGWVAGLWEGTKHRDRSVMALRLQTNAALTRQKGAHVCKRSLFHLEPHARYALTHRPRKRVPGVGIDNEHASSIGSANTRRLATVGHLSNAKTHFMTRGRCRASSSCRDLRAG
jgi:hypothetical protein